MRILLTIIMAAMTLISARGAAYSYTFSNTPISEAIVRISKEHPEINISFIYKELDQYKTSAKINTDNAYEALQQTIGFNPISVIRKDNSYFIEAMQHGKFRYTGQAIGSDNEPVVAATVMLLSPKDSTVITYGITDENGRFSIPCDHQGVIARLTSVGYNPVYRKCDNFALGIVIMTQKPEHLHTVNVEAANDSLLSDKSVYRPTQRQKNASQTATDLLVRMAIPQLNTRLGSSSVSTVSGQPVAIYIDYVPASKDELNMIRISDVRYVEYLEYPADPRFQGNRYVINFRMVKYEYGGYIKALATENFIANSGYAQANGRLVKGSMTYDVMGYGYYIANDHFGTDQTETFVLPQKSFQRQTATETSRYREHDYETSVRALYSATGITANSQIAVGSINVPHNDNSGRVDYTGDIIDQSRFATLTDSKADYLTYRGYYFLKLPESSSLSATLNYSYTHTDQNSAYSETGLTTIFNGASDNTHKGQAYVNYTRSWSTRHTLQAKAIGLYEHNLTDYSGSVDARDKSITRYGQVGASYSFKAPKISASFGLGWSWIATALNQNKSLSDFPYMDLSVRYIPRKKHSVSGVFHYSVWPPNSNYKSENIIHVSPYLWYTGNPLLKSHRSYDIGLSYTIIPSNRFNMTAFASTWMVGNRNAFVYEPTSEGIIRTIRQPIGSFLDFNYGINASVKQLEGKLQMSGQLAQRIVHNGEPFNNNRSIVTFYLQAMYYVGNFNFALAYRAENGTHNYSANSGVWTHEKDFVIIQAGWSNPVWNISVKANNLQRWNWRATHDTMSSPYYSFSRWVSNASCHAFVQLSATYTIGFGKKVNQNDNISRQSGASSGILK